MKSYKPGTRVFTKKDVNVYFTTSNGEVKEKLPPKKQLYIVKENQLSYKVVYINSIGIKDPVLCTGRLLKKDLHKVKAVSHYSINEFR